MVKQNNKSAKLKWLVTTLTVSVVVGGSVNATESFESKNKMDVESKVDGFKLQEMVQAELKKSMELWANKESEKSKIIVELEQDKRFSKINSESLLKDKEFNKYFGHKEVSKLKNIIVDMQIYAIYINQKFKVNKSISEDIVYAAYIEAYKKQFSPLLLLSLIENESSFNPKATSHVGARGLTQIMPEIHSDKIEKYNADLTRVHDNIKVGATVLKEYLDKYNGNMVLALQQYNGSLKDKSLKYSNNIFAQMEVFKDFKKESIRTLYS